jgi:hypothetical protein
MDADHLGGRVPTDLKRMISPAIASFSVQQPTDSFGVDRNNMSFNKETFDFEAASQYALQTHRRHGVAGHDNQWLCRLRIWQ